MSFDVPKKQYKETPTKEVLQEKKNSKINVNFIPKIALL